jgi:hypothetical protein
MVQISSNASSNKLVVSSIAPPLPPRRIHKDSGACLLPNSGSSNNSASGVLPQPPPIPSHNESSLTSNDGEDSKSISGPTLSHPRRLKTENKHSSVHGPLPLPPTEIATSKFISYFIRYLCN